MKRRRFIQSLVAVFSLPGSATLSLRSASAALPAASAVPTKARFWAVYMSGLHGECTPQTLQNLLHIPEVDARRYVSQLIADGVIKPNPLLQKSVSKLLRPTEDSPLETLKKRLDMKARRGSGNQEMHRVIGKADLGDDEPGSEEASGNVDPITDTAIDSEDTRQDTDVQQSTKLQCGPEQHS